MKVRPKVINFKQVNQYFSDFDNFLKRRNLHNLSCICFVFAMKI